MTLLKYVVNDIKNNKSDERERIYRRIEHYILNDIYDSMSDCIMAEYCPSYFKCLKGTPYEKNYRKKCETSIDEQICKKCWNREILTVKSMT